MNEIFNNYIYYELVKELKLHKDMYLSRLKENNKVKIYDKNQLYRMYYIIPTLTEVELYLRNEINIYNRFDKNNEYFIVISKDVRNNTVHISSNTQFVSLCKNYDSFIPIIETQIAINELELTKLFHQRRISKGALFPYKERLKILKDDILKYNSDLVEKYNNINIQFLLFILNNITEIKVCNKCLSKLYLLKHNMIKNNIHIL